MNIEIDPITGAPIIKPKDSPTVINPIMPVVAEPTSSPGLNTPTPIPASIPFIAPATTPIPTKSVAPPVQPSAALAAAMENAKVTADATVEESANHISSLYPEIKRILKEGGGDTQQQEQTFAKLKELLDEVVWGE
jgi:hypothetical protein